MGGGTDRTPAPTLGGFSPPTELRPFLEGSNRRHGRTGCDVTEVRRSQERTPWRARPLGSLSLSGQRNHGLEAPDPGPGVRICEPPCGWRPARGEAAGDGRQEPGLPSLWRGPFLRSGLWAAASRVTVKGPSRSRDRLPVSCGQTLEGPRGAPGRALPLRLQVGRQRYLVDTELRAVAGLIGSQAGVPSAHSFSNSFSRVLKRF